MLNFKKFTSRTFDWWLFASAIFLVALGLSAIYSVDLSRGDSLTFFKKQLAAAGIGLVILFAGSMLQHTVWRYSAKWWYALSLVLLVVVLFFGRTIRGTTGWFAFTGFSVQPVELSKIGLIFMLSAVITRFGREFSRPLFFFGTGLFTFILCALVLLQPDLGSAVLLGVIWLGMLWLVGARRLYLAGLLAAFTALSVIGWFFLLQDYQRARLTTFINPASDPQGSGYNVTQSIIAVGAGKLFGRGLGFGSQSQLRFLPEAQTDFVFSVIAEELGFAGVLVLMVLFGVLFWRLLFHVRHADDGFNAAVASGFCILFFAQFFINIGAAIGILPITGVTLPFVSYGGSSLLANMLMIGVVESMATGSIKRGDYS